MRRGYIRSSSWCTRDEQEAALHAHGVEIIYVEGQNEKLADAVRSLREGDELCIYSLDRLAGERIALEKWMRAVRDRRAVIVEVLKNRRDDDAEDVADMIFDAMRRRGHKREDAQRYGKKAKHRKVRAKISRDEAIRIWRDAAHTRQEAAKLIGMSPATCFRRYGARGVPDGRPRTK